MTSTTFRRSPKYYPLATRKKGTRVLDLSDAIALQSRIWPHQKLILMLILLSLKDRAAEFEFKPRHSETDEFGLDISYKVGGVWYALVPPPDLLAKYVMFEVKKLAGLSAPGRRLATAVDRLLRRSDRDREKPLQATFQIKADNQMMNVSATAYPSEHCARIVFTFSDCPASVSEHAHSTLVEMWNRLKENAMDDEDPLSLPES